MTSAPRQEWYLDETSLIEEIRRGPASATGEGARLRHPPAIPGYDDLIELQRGGQGVVYAARQRSTGRRVAVKVMLDGAFASTAARRRFEREVDLIASLDHPNIVQVYDSGITPPPDERPYCVMRFIEGVSLHEHAATLRREREPRQARLALIELFAIICEAVSFAHQHGVIHRDLKPGNIRIDAEGRPHILDFGLAKATAPGSEPAIAVSTTGEFLGSLPWASPEHVEGDPRAVDTRSDVYSLGVILYELLTGRLPYDVSGGVRQALERIATAEPKPPRSIVPDLDDEIEAIAMKCLAKDAGQRYQSAVELARDVRRFLVGEPIEARRDSGWYVMRRTLRRYRLAAGVSLAMAIVLAAGAAAFSWQAHEATQARAAEADQRRLAERRFDDVRELARRFMFDIHDEIAPLAGSNKARELLVSSALEYLEKLSLEAGDDEDLLGELASAYGRVGDIQGNPYRPNLGNSAGAIESYRKALDIREALVAAAPQDVGRSRAYADALLQLGELQQWTGDSDASTATFVHARDVLEELTIIAPDDRGVRRVLVACEVKLGDAISWQGRPEEALPHYTAALEIIEDLARTDPDNVREALNLSACHSKVGYCLSQKGALDAALEHHRTALDLTERLLEEHPDDGFVRRTVSINANQIGSVLVLMDDPEAALEHYRRALSLALELQEADPANPLAASDVTYTRNKIGEALTSLYDFRGALAEFEAAWEVRERLAQADPDNAGFQRDLGVSRYKLAAAYVALGEDVREPVERRLESWGLARTWCERARNVLLAMREQGSLREVDEGMPAMLLDLMDRCDAAIRKLHAEAIDD